MNTLNLKSAALFFATTAATALIIQACGGQVNAVAQSTGETSDPLEGTWQASVTIRDCTTGAVLANFKGLTAFHRGGTTTADNNQPSATHGAALGTWKRNANTSYTASYRFFRYNPDGTPAGSQRLTRNITLGIDGNSLTGTISAQVLDNADTVLTSICGSESTVRFS